MESFDPEKFYRNRFLIYQAIVQVWYDRRTPEDRKRPIQRKEILPYLSSAMGLFNALRFLYAHGFLGRGKAYGWVPLYIPCPKEEDFCWKHGTEQPCEKCEREKK